MAKIVTAPNEVLKTVSKPVEYIDKKVRKIIKEMETSLSEGKDFAGIGLSAVQIGKPLRILTTFLPPSGNPDDETQKPQIQTFINPEITEFSKDQTIGPDKKKPILEGCLSVPGIWGPINRRKWIKVKWQTPAGEWKQEKFKNFPARVIQHEMDHLNGILFIDRSLKDKMPLYELNKEKLEEISFTH